MRASSPGALALDLGMRHGPGARPANRPAHQIRQRQARGARLGVPLRTLRRAGANLHPHDASRAHDAPFPLWGSEGAQPPASLHRGPAKRGPKEYAGLGTLGCPEPALRTPPRCVSKHARNGGRGPTSRSPDTRPSRSSCAAVVRTSPSARRPLPLCAGPHARVVASTTSRGMIDLLDGPVAERQPESILHRRGLAPLDKAAQPLSVQRLPTLVRLRRVEYLTQIAQNLPGRPLARSPWDR